MSDQQHRHDVLGDDQPRNQQQSNMDQLSPSSDLESNILARLGLRATGAEEWQKQVRKIELIAEESKPGAVERISLYLKAPHEGTRMAAVRALLKLAKHNSGLVPVGPFIEMLGDLQPHVRAVAVEALTAYGPWLLPYQGLSDLMKKLVSKNKREDKLVRMMIVHLLSALYKETPLQSLPPAPEYSRYYVGFKVYAEALQSLVAALQDDDWQVRESAVIALGPLMNRLSRDQREQLDAMLYDDDAFVREAARLVQRGRAALGEQSLEERLLYDLRSPVSTRQSQAAFVLGEMGHLEQETLNELKKVAQDSQAKSEVRESALLALAELRAPIDEKRLSMLLNDRDESIREATLILHNAIFPGRDLLDKEKPGTAQPPISDNVSDFGQYKSRRRTMPKEGG